jgi:hypothetical protein
MARLPAKTSSIAIEPKMSIKSDLEKRIDSLIEDALPYFRSIFKQVALANPQNARTLCEFIVAERDEHNLKLSSRLTRIKIIYLFNRYLDYKSFEQITKRRCSRISGFIKEVRITISYTQMDWHI